MRRPILAAVGAAFLSVALAVPALAGGGWSEPFGFTEQVEIDRGCDIVEELTREVRGRAWFDASGEWQRDIVQFSYSSVIRSTVTGESITAKATQTAEFTPETGTLRGQGAFIRVPGEGLVVLDAGRLVFDLADGSTIFASAGVIPFDGDGLAAADAALCALLS
jgi:hypothetical protein